MWSLQSNLSHIATPSQSWVDDYVAWLGLCCSKDENTGEYCEVENGKLNNLKKLIIKIYLFIG